MNTKIMTISPKKAEEILKLHNNTNPRSISLDRANEYAKEMKNGKWTTTHEGIAFTGTETNFGELVDGQTRLKASVISGVPLTTLVTFGAPQHAKINFGRRRTMRCVTGFDKDDIAIAIACIQASIGVRPKTFDVELFLERYPRISSVIPMGNHLNGITLAPVIAAFCVAHLNGVHEASKWFHQLSTMDPSMPVAINRLLYTLQKNPELGNTRLTANGAKSFAIALFSIDCAKNDIALQKIYPDACIKKRDQLMGSVGKFIRENIKLS